MRFSAVFNRDGGTFRTLDMQAFCEEAREIFLAAGHSIDFRVVDGDQVVAALEQVARHEDGRILLVGGGDGTISAAAAIALHHRMPLAVLPGGTMNLFARSLGVPLDLRAALEALAQGELSTADIASANDRPFVHQFSVGVHTRLVRIREGFGYRSRIGKILANCRAVLLAMIRPPRFEVEIRTPLGVDRRLASAVTVTNNPFGEGHIPHADTLDGGALGVYVMGPLSSWALARFCVSLLLGRWKQNPQLTEAAVAAVTLHFPRRKSSAKAVIDGELMDLPRQVELRIHPGALRVVLPRLTARVAA